MTLHLYFILSTYTPLNFQPNMEAVTADTENISSSLFVKIFSYPLTHQEDVATTLLNSGDSGVATFIITKKVVYLRNPLIHDLEGKYPQVAKIKELAQSLADQFDQTLPLQIPICNFAKDAQKLEGIVIHDIINCSK